MEQYDVVYIGGGPAGYVGAIRSAQLGMKTACVEKRKALGGTCLNIGCIPSKALLDSSEHFAFVKHKAAKHGLVVGDLKIDLGQMMKRKDQVVTGLTTGIAGLFKKNKIAHLVGHGRITAPGTVEVVAENGAKETISAKNIVIATGSDVARIPVAALDGVRVISSTEALALPQVPKSMVVIGGGAIGLEMGSVWMRLGADVTVVEYNERIASFADHQISGELLKILQRQGMKFKLATKVVNVQNVGSKAAVEMEPAAGGTRETIEADVVLVAVGRKPFTDNLGLDKIGLATDKAGRIEIDNHFRTKVAGVYAIGDVVRGPMLAHKAEDEGIAVAEIMAGELRRYSECNLHLAGTRNSWYERTRLQGQRDRGSHRDLSLYCQRAC